MRHDWIYQVGMLSLVSALILAGHTYAETNHYQWGTGS
jgi:hypothetical protein